MGRSEESKRRKAEQDKAQYQARRAAGLCITCQEPSKGARCIPCQHKYRDNARAKGRNYQRERDVKYKALVYAHYGNECACCGEARRTMLTIEHIGGGGRAHRKKINNHIYNAIIKEGYPDSYEILCANCNTSRARNGGVCEHNAPLVGR